MKESKNIERLFQEKFKDFEANPPLDSWENIEARLNKKKNKRRVIPFWFKSAGIAASLAIVFFLFMDKGNDSSLIKNDLDVLKTNPVSNVEENKDIRTSNDQVSPITSVNESGLLNNNIVLENNNSVKKEELIQNKFNTVNNNLNTVVVSNKNQIKIKNSSNENKEVFNNQSLANTNKKQNNTNSTKQIFDIQNASNSINNTVVSSKEENKLSNKGNNQLLVDPNPTINTQNVVINSKDQNKLNINKEDLPIDIDSKNNSIEDGQLVFENNKEEKNILINKSKIESLNSKNELNDEIVISENSISIKTTDSLLIKNENIIANAIEDSILLASVEPEENPLEKLLKEKLEGEDADEKEKEKRNKWAVSTVASPVYFNSTSSGSAIDEQFKDNSKSYENSLSFGLGVEYDISNKFSLKTGINTLAFNYSTNDVFYTTTLRSVDYNVKTIERNRNGENIILANRNAMIDDNDVDNYVQNNIGSLSQNISYIEVPLEVNYKLLDKKFGIDLVGGMSTLFLNSNSVSLISNGTEMEIGKANNLNNIHFSSNVGLGFKYTFWKSFQANFQPMFKYQINTFSNDSGNFKPYFVGLYSGISFSF